MFSPSGRHSRTRSQPASTRTTVQSAPPHRVYPTRRAIDSTGYRAARILAARRRRAAAASGGVPARPADVLAGVWGGADLGRQRELARRVGDGVVALPVVAPEEPGHGGWRREHLLVGGETRQGVGQQVPPL